MIGFTAHLETDGSPAAVFDLIADMADLHRWNPNVRNSQRISGDRYEQGSRYVSMIVRGPIRMTARSQLVMAELGRKVQYEGSIAGFWSTDSPTFVPSGDGTRITFQNETRAPRWLRPVVPLLNATFQRRARRSVEGAARYLANNSAQ